MKTIKYTITACLALLLLSLKVGDNKGEYHIPNFAYSIFLGDLELDGDIDIVTGHQHSSSSDWGGGHLQ